MTVGSTTDAVLSRFIDEGNGETRHIWDISIDDDGDIKTEDFFDTSLLMSLFAEKRATSSEVPTSHLRRGWIGNETFEDGFEIGSKIWVYEQSRLMIDTVNSVKSAAREGLQWYVDQGLLLSFTVGAVLFDNTIELEIVCEREPSVVIRKFFTLWDNSGVTNTTEGTST